MTKVHLLWFCAFSPHLMDPGTNAFADPAQGRAIDAVPFVAQCRPGMRQITMVVWPAYA